MKFLGRPWIAVALALVAADVARAMADESIACGETLERALATTPVELAVAACAGEVLAITVVPTLDVADFAPQWRLIDAESHAVLLDNGDHKCDGRCATAPLPESGTYTLRVVDTGIGAGVFTVTVEAVSATANGESNGPPAPTCGRTAPDGTRSIADGGPLTGSIDPRGETDTYTLVAAPDDVVHAEVAASGDGPTPTWEAYDASGARLTLADETTTCVGACDTMPVAGGGVVTLLVACKGDTGGYTITTNHGPPESTTSTTVTGTTITTTTTDGGPTTTTATVSTTTVPGGTTTSTLAPEFDLGDTIHAPAPGAPLHLGTALAASDTRLVIGAPHEDAGPVRDAGAVLVVDVAGAPGSPGFGAVTRLVATPATGDAFGAAVTVAGAELVVGAPGEGAAYVYDDVAATPRRLAPSAGEAGDEFGAAVAVVGDLVAVGAPGADAGAGRVYVFEARSGKPHVVLETPVPTSGARFGASLASSDGQLLVGAPGTAGPGAAFVFDPDTGELRETLSAPTPGQGDEFGAAVAFSGGARVVGAPGHADETGLVVLFRDGKAEPIDAGPLSPGARFGQSVGGDADRVVGGAPGAFAVGAVITLDVGTGTVTTVQGTSPSDGDAFGSGVAAAGGLVFVGVPGSDTGTTEGGAVQAFEGATLVASFRQRLSTDEFGAAATRDDDRAFVVGAPGRGLVERIDPRTGSVLGPPLVPPAPTDGGFGASVAVVDGVVAVGAPREPDSGLDRAGVVYLLPDGAAPVRVADPHPEAGAQFGFAVGAVGGDLLASAPFAGASDTGVVYRLSQGGALRVTYAKPAPAAGDFFGAAVAGDGTDVLVGAPFDESGGASRGGVYLFDADTAELRRFIPAPDGGAGLFGAAVAIGDWIVVGAPLADGVVAGAGAAYVIERATGVVRHRLERPGAASGDQFGAAVALVGDRVVVGAPLVDDHASDTGAVYVFDAASGALVQALRSPPQGAFDHFGAAVAASTARILVGSPGPSRVYLFDAIVPAGAVGALRLARASATATATAGSTCGNGLVEAGEACDDGNTVDDDDCRNDCTPGPCCALAPTPPDCDDGDRCTIDTLDPVLGCTHRPSGAPDCCTTDAECPGGQCRVCIGCFVYRWDCCDEIGPGSVCIPKNPACAGRTCVDAAYCQCEGKLDCGADPVPAEVTTPFASACDTLRLQGSIAADGSGSATKADLLLARRRARAARRSLRATVRTARAMAASHTLTRACRKQIVAQVRVVRHAIPRGRRLRACILGGG